MKIHREFVTEDGRENEDENPRPIIIRDPHPIITRERISDVNLIDWMGLVKIHIQS